MKEYTQTTFGIQGNCWQTAVACLLEVDPKELPDQSRCDQRDEKGIRKQPFFINLIGAYLRKHHNLAFHEINVPGIHELLTVKDPGWHFLIGRTIRSGDVDKADIHHVVVARYGEMMWNPHPDRSGLTDCIRLALLIPFPKEWENVWSGVNCECPKCL